MMRQTTLGEAGAVTSAEAPGANNVVPPLVSAVGAPVATPVCMLTAPALAADCGKDNMQLAVSATTSDRAPGTNSTETLPDTCGEVPETNSDEVLAWVSEQVKLVCRQRKTARDRRKHMKKKMKIKELRETVKMMRQTTLGEAGAATSAEASGANNVVSPLVSPVGAPVATPVCVLTAPALATDCGKYNMRLAVSATTSDLAPGTSSTETLPDTCGKQDEV